MTSRERVKTALLHQSPDRVPVDFDATAVSGIHISVVEELRAHYGLEKIVVKMHEPYQCLGKVDDDLAEALGTDVGCANGPSTFFGFKNENWQEWRTPWGQDVLIPGQMNTTTAEDGTVYLYPEGDLDAPASARLPGSSYFFDTIVRQEPLPADDADLNVEDNLEEFKPITDDTLAFVKSQAEALNAAGRFTISNVGGTGLGDIALVPAPFLKYPKGIRDIAEWYMSTVARRDYVNEIFERQYEIAIENLKKLNDYCGEMIDALFVCGTDFGTQDSSFCSPATFTDLYAPHYKKLNEWIHANTGWATFKHSCGSIPKFIPLLADAGFDILNPVQTSAAGMDPEFLKNEFGKDVLFWGGGVDTQQILPFGTTDDVKKEVMHKLKIFSVDGGFVFNTIHNIQAKTPTENVVAMIDTVHEFNSAGG